VSDTEQQLTNLAGIVHLASDLVTEHGLLTVMAWGGQLGGLLARRNDQGTRAWTVAQAAEHVGLEVADALGAYALWRGAYDAWAMHAADLRLAELGEAQLRLPG
jgi:hypothetical protein